MNLSTAVLVSYGVGSFVWVEDPEVVWIDGEVVEVNGEEIIVKCTSGKTVATKASEMHPKDPEFPEYGVEDMTRLAYLHEPGVLQNLKRRYDGNEIYTYTGNILIAVNPFRRIPNLYDKDVMGQYKGVPIGELSPHPFAVADSAYRQMISEGTSQSILVSGESGAGKTESTKMLMCYLAFMGGRAAAEGRSVEQQVLESNPVLEAFGNAKTVRNNNSSRFGKFVEIQFDQMGRISGAAIRTYLLERSRVCQVSDPERNYHCFYMLCAAPQEDVEKYRLGDPRMFHYLNQTSCYELDGVDDSKDYVATRRAMDVVGINADEQDAIFRVVAAVLHLGNVEFAKGDEMDSSEPKDDKSRFHLKTAAELLMCDEKSLEDSLCKRVIVTRDESITKWLDPSAAAVNRDALAKIVYSRLFDWLVNKINNSIGQDPDSKTLIGVLDIYGFESFKTNSFEQFCINLTNEKLQQHFNQHVFKMEQEEYTKEEIDWSYIEFVDNQDVLDLIEKKPGGIIALLDEACMFPRSTNETFAQKLYQTFKDHQRFSKPKLARSDFTICHYAGEVTYQTEHFLDKNKDYVVAEHQGLLSESKCSFVSGLFPPLPEDSAKSSKFSSIGSRFKQQLCALLETLSATEPHYIRCVKPNNVLKPYIFENTNVLQQLRCGGVMEAIRISCAGYPTRKTFDEFVSRFSILAPDTLNDSNGACAVCKRLVDKVNLNGYQIGKTKVFLRAGQMAELDARRSEVLGRSARVIQRKVRSYFCRKHFLLLQESAIAIQTLIRGQIACHRYECLRRETASLRIQKHSRRFLARKAYKMLCSCAVAIQTSMRRVAARDELQFRKQTQAAIILQSHFREHLARLHYLRLRKATTTVQCVVRGLLAREELRKLKMAAKETGALQAAKSMLEKQVEELTCHLELERRMRAEIEETKNQENAKLHSALQEIEKGSCKKASEQVPVIQEVAINENELVNKLTASVSELINKPTESDSELVNKLNAENEMLKGMVSSLEKKIDETEKKFERTHKLSEERLQQAMDAESKIIELKTAMQRLEEKLSDMEAEDQVLRQQALLNSPKKTSEQLSSQPLENGHLEDSSPSKKFGTDSMRKSQNERLHVSSSSFTIYRCLAHWKYFEAERTSVFDKLIQLIGSAIENQDNNDHMAYWLSNASILLVLLQRTLKSSGGGSQQTAVPTSFFSRMAQSFRGSPSSANLKVGKDIARQVEAKYPALLFKQQLTAYVEKIFGIVRDNSKKELSPLVAICVQAPKASNESDLATCWPNIINSLDLLLSTLKTNSVPPVLVRKIFCQIFIYLNIHLFNSILLHRECCVFTNGEFLKAGLVELEQWCGNAKDEYAGSAWDELKQTRQAVEFLITKQKSSITYDNMTNDLCPALSVQQLYRLCTIYNDDDDDMESVSPDVISSMKNIITDDSNDDDRSSYVLEEDSSIPFSVDDISGSIQETDFSDVKAPEVLLEKPGFEFLQD
ncbi:hypothetical protein K2173_005725 [Erythroxylum novogranatense]|uniref:Myosin XI n=1 Tax=Erythroxylum novogranatense TaxID=1862640 RepID=A0AAV8SRD0_9ROSI|nr:hypothetical protein K2173_005725 [Erythroxylum novogranatense]